MADFPGPCCADQLITKEELASGKVNKAVSGLKNGIILEISTYLDTLGKSSNELYCIVTQLDPNFTDTTAKYLRNKVSRLFEQKKKLAIQTTFEYDSECEIDDVEKCSNLVKYRTSKLLKYSNKLENQIEEQKCTYKDIVNRVGHFSIRNINKRDETAKRNLHALRDSQRLAIKQRQLKDLSHNLREAKGNVLILQKLTVSNSHDVCYLKDKTIVLQEQIDLEKSKKCKVQKLNSYFKNETNILKAKLKENKDQIENEKPGRCTSCKELVCKVQEKDSEILELRDRVEDLKLEKLETKCDKKSFNDNVRLCIIDLAGLEVAVEKVPEVIRTVSKHLYNRDFEKNELPTSSTVQNVVDEGHFLAKTFISQMLSKASNWGLNRDGTTRQKQKILDTAITLDSGKIMCLGFNRVAHETAVSITEVTKSHIKELPDLNVTLSSGCENKAESEAFIKTSLEKLAYTISDRAANEKKASVLLNEWRDQVIGVDSTDHVKVNSFHCMAHVLLGFHTYICKDMKEHEDTLSTEHGPLSRDNLSSFKFWKNKKSVLQRVLKTTSDVFGPSGDFHGVRDKWEAHCAVNGIKSVIGNYKDNRFNGLFQTSAEIYLHRDDFLISMGLTCACCLSVGSCTSHTFGGLSDVDFVRYIWHSLQYIYSTFIKVLQTVKSPNLLLKAVMADLQSDVIMTLVQSMGLLYINLTGPYWNLVVGSKVPYLELHREIAKITKYLDQVEQNPQTLLETSHWSRTDPFKVSHVPHKSAFTKRLTSVDDHHKDLLYNTVRLASKVIKRTIEKQLVDFLEEGKFSKDVSEEEMKRSGFAHITNLGCEHHFGSLDSSQKRRPSASLHHHSSVQLIKENRTAMMNWLTEMPNLDRSRLIKKARKGGQTLRKLHHQEEREVLSTIHSEMTSKPAKPKNKKRKAETGIFNTKKRQQCADSDSESDTFSDLEEESKLLEELPSVKDVKENDYVVVAYQDNWYPGIISV